MSLLQSAASDPSHSVWVTASAGTGKTKVLTDRVLRLMLADTPPAKILCLTFTNAAAAEMANRIHQHLSAWVIMEEPALTQKLQELTGSLPGTATLTLARRLFAEVLDTPEGLKIQTIHSFCQSLMRRFPLEAGIAPHFTVIDERTTFELLEEARLRLLNSAADTALKDAIAYIAWHVHETGLHNLLREITSNRARLEAIFEAHDGVEGAIAALYATLGVRQTETEETLLATACTETAYDAAALRLCCTAWLEGTASENARGELLATWLAAPEMKRRVLFTSYTELFLTKEHKARSSLATKGTLQRYPHIEETLAQEQRRLLAYVEHKKTVKTALLTTHLLTISKSLLTEYHSLKSHRSFLDYSDLILTTGKLLKNPTISPWILYKLDGGLDHILIDEAQDTSPEQWQIIDTLCAEFFAGEGAKKANRTLFVVGDEKQSIFSFQGADPLTFHRMHQLFAEKAASSTKRFRSIRLDMSFRSTSAVLAAVDAVCAAEEIRSAITFSAEKITHTAFRAGHAGTVELWPLISPPPKAEKDMPWPLPAHHRGEYNPQKILAELIARTVHGWLKERRLLAAKGRPVTPGDILILVRQRKAFTGYLVSALKKLDIPVAGIDRMVITDNLAVMDLMALGHFLLLPQDDLTLATVLKTPLIGLDEEALFRLADGRGALSLWERLGQKAGESDAYRQAYHVLAALLQRVDFCSPFELYSTLLDCQGGRKQLCSRLGVEINDPLDEFLALALTYEQTHIPSLQGFLHWLETGSTEIKRDLEQGRNQVRIMTVHGSKGLQAPIIFMPDTTQIPESKARLLWHEKLLLWPGSSAGSNQFAAMIREKNRQKELDEYKRLLYVALTRAEDELIICGWESKKALAQECWYNVVKNGLAGTAQEAPFIAPPQVGYDISGNLLRLVTPQEAEVSAAARPLTSTARTTILPAFLESSAPPEPVPPLPLSPSLPEEEAPPARSPLFSAERFQRGTLIHKLLQLLPGLPASDQAEAAASFLAYYGKKLTAGEQEAIRENVLSLLRHPDFAPIFGPGSKAEVPITGMIDGKNGQKRIIAGQVDRLVVAEKSLLIIDYKTNHHPPEKTTNIPLAYLKQMAAYASLLRSIYPAKQVNCALVWTEIPLLMPVPEEMLREYYL